MNRRFINFLSLSRIPLSILFALAILFLEKPLFICVLLSLIIYLTDYYDGKLARIYNLASDRGAVVDIFADLFFVVLAFFSMYVRDYIPFFIIVVMIIKFVEFWWTSYNFDRKNDEIVPKYDNFGKFVAVLFYILPIFTLLMFFIFGRNIGYSIVRVICILITLSSIVSSVLRIRFMYHRV